MGEDRNNLVPLCRVHHDEHDHLGQRTFWVKYGRMPRVDAERITKEYDEAKANLNLISSVPAFVRDTDRDRDRATVQAFLEWTVGDPLYYDGSVMPHLRARLADWPGTGPQP